MKTTTTLLLLLIMSYTQAQTIDYIHDNAGNRTARCESGNKSNNGGNLDPKDEKPTLAELLALVDKTQQDKITKEEKEDSNLELNVYPNPTTDRISVSKTYVGATTNAQATFILLDSKGKILDKIISNENLVSFQVSHLAKGIYFVYFLDDSEGRAWRVVKE